MLLLFTATIAALLLHSASASTCPDYHLQSTDARQTILLSNSYTYESSLSCSYNNYQLTKMARFTPPSTNTYEFSSTEGLLLAIEIIDGNCTGTSLGCTAISFDVPTASALLTGGREYTILVNRATSKSLPPSLTLAVEIKCPNVQYFIGSTTTAPTELFSSATKVKNVITCAGQGSTLQDIYSLVYTPLQTGLYSVRVPNVNLGTSVGSALEIRKGTCNSLQVEYCSTSQTTTVGPSSILLQAYQTYTISLGAAGTPISLPVDNQLELTYLDTQPQCTDNAIGSGGGTKSISATTVNAFFSCGTSTDIAQPAHYVSFRPDEDGSFDVKIESNTPNRNYTVDMRESTCHGVSSFFGNICTSNVVPGITASNPLLVDKDTTYVIIVRATDGSVLRAEDVRVVLTKYSGSSVEPTLAPALELALIIDGIVLVVVALFSLIFGIYAKRKFPRETSAGIARIRTLSVTIVTLSLVIMVTVVVIFFGAFVYPFLLVVIAFSMMIYKLTGQDFTTKRTVVVVNRAIIVFTVTKYVLVAAMIAGVVQIGMWWIFYFILSLFFPFITLFAFLSLILMGVLISVLHTYISVLRSAVAIPNDAVQIRNVEAGDGQGAVVSNPVATVVMMAEPVPQRVDVEKGI